MVPRLLPLAVEHLDSREGSHVDAILTVDSHAVRAAFPVRLCVVHMRERPPVLDRPSACTSKAEHGIAHRVIDNQSFAIRRQRETVRPRDSIVDDAGLAGAGGQ